MRIDRENEAVGMQVMYLFDPLCGWCYGASAALQQIAALPHIVLKLAPTGLFSGTGARPMDSHFASFAWQNDQRIARVSGRIFSGAYKKQILDTADGMFDSGPATLGLVAVGLYEVSGEIAALNALQHARYVEGRNTSEQFVVAEVLAEAGFKLAANKLEAPDAELLAALQTRVQTAQAEMTRFGINGVPALITGEGEKRRVLGTSALFGKFDLLAEQLGAA
jgi:putative protein-disulfide isomerase